VRPQPLFIRSLSIRQEHLAIYGDRYPFTVPVVRNLDELVFDSPVTFLIGENGSGKSTLIEALALACGFKAEGGSKSLQFEAALDDSELHEVLHVTRGPRIPGDHYFLRAESFYNVATEIDRRELTSYYGGTSLHRMSHGEAFFTLLTDRLIGGGLYLFDEPEAALSPTRQMAMLTRMHELVLDASQLIIATHSPILMAYPGATIYEIADGELRRVEYEQTEHFTVTRQFFLQRERMLKILLGGAE
jgi:predicted ATPase